MPVHVPLLAPFESLSPMASALTAAASQQARSRATRSATKPRILAAAEHLFLMHGYEATSMRAITTLANVNLAAVNYHFGSKEELFTQILTQRLDPMMAERLRLLDALESAGRLRGALAVEQLIAAMFLPALAFSRDPERGGEDFLKFLGRAFADPSPFVQRLLGERYAEANQRFKRAFAVALPGLPAQDLSMRLHFILDAISSTLASEDARRLIAAMDAGNESGASDDVSFLARFAPFLSASLRAQVNQPAQREAIAAVQALLSSR